MLGQFVQIRVSVAGDFILKTSDAVLWTLSWDAEGQVQQTLLSLDWKVHVASPAQRTGLQVEVFLEKVFYLEQ